MKIILLVPRIKKSLLSVSRLTAANKVFVEFHPNVCLVKEKENHLVVLQGKLEDGLYKLHIPQTENLTKPTTHSIVNPSINPVIELNSTESKRRVDSQCLVS